MFFLLNLLFLSKCIMMTQWCRLLEFHRTNISSCCSNMMRLNKVFFFTVYTNYCKPTISYFISKCYILNNPRNVTYLFVTKALAITFTKATDVNTVYIPQFCIMLHQCVHLSQSSTDLVTPGGSTKYCRKLKRRLKHEYIKVYFEWI